MQMVLISLNLSIIADIQNKIAIIINNNKIIMGSGLVET